MNMQNTIKVMYAEWSGAKTKTHTHTHIPYLGYSLQMTELDCAMLTHNSITAK